MRSTPASSMFTVRITPPEEPSLAIAWQSAAGEARAGGGRWGVGHGEGEGVSLARRAFLDKLLALLLVHARPVVRIAKAVDVGRARAWPAGAGVRAGNACLTGWGAGERSPPIANGRCRRPPPTGIAKTCPPLTLSQPATMMPAVSMFLLL